VSATPFSPQIPDEKTRSFAKTGSGQTQKRRSVFHSGMEFEAVCRYQMPLITVIINNNGIGSFNPGAKNAPCWFLALLHRKQRSRLSRQARDKRKGERLKLTIRAGVSFRIL
jgi:hypothetical protein